MTWTNLHEVAEQPRVRLGDVFPAPAFLHAKDLAGIFLPYGAGLSITFGTLFAGLQFPDGVIHSLLAGAGTSGCFVIGLFIWMTYRQVEREWQLHEDKERSRFTRLPQPQEHVHRYATPDAWHELRNHYDNPPTLEFIKFLFDKQGTGRRILSERAIGALPDWSETAWNEWLDALEKEGYLERVDDRPNAARRWVEGRTLTECLEHFAPALPQRDLQFQAVQR